MDQYNPKHIDEALKRMEEADKLRNTGSHRSSSNIMSFFDDIDEEYELRTQKSAAETKREEYLQSITLLKKILKEKGTPSELTRTTAFGALIETTNFFTITDDKKVIIKSNMQWCNEIYEKYLDSHKKGTT